MSVKISLSVVSMMLCLSCGPTHNSKIKDQPNPARYPKNGEYAKGSIILGSYVEDYKKLLSFAEKNPAIYRMANALYFSNEPLCPFQGSNSPYWPKDEKKHASPYLLMVPEQVKTEFDKLAKEEMDTLVANIQG